MNNIQWVNIDYQHHMEMQEIQASAICGKLAKHMQDFYKTS